MFLKNEVTEKEKMTSEEFIPTKNVETSVPLSSYKLDVSKESYIEEFNYSNEKELLYGIERHPCSVRSYASFPDRHMGGDPGHL